MRSFCQLILLAHAVCAITVPRAENDFDRRRQASLTHPGFNEHQTRFGLNSGLQNFPPLPAAITSPPPNVQFQQSIFPQQPQQPYVPQFNNNIPPINNLPLQNNNFPTQNSFQFNPQQPSVNPSIFPNTFQPQQNVRQIPQQTQNILPPAIPTIPTFGQNGHPIQQSAPTFQTNIPASPISLTQRPTQQAFLPTIATQSQSINQPIFSQPSPITIQPAPNLGPQNFNLNNAQLPFQPSLGQASIFSNGQSSQIQDLLEQQSKENLEKLKELQERARIIQKHQEFVQKQQQKQQEKVEKLHEEFIKKQATKSIPNYSTTESYTNYWRGNVERRRPILPHETNLFKKAVELYEKEHPTTTTSTTTTTTTTTTTPPPPPPSPSTPRYRPRSKPKSRNVPQDRDKRKLYNEIKSFLQENEMKGFDDSLRAKSIELLKKPDILKQLQIALAENPEDFSEKNFTSREISLNGQKFEVIRTSNPNLIPEGAITADSSNLAQIMAASRDEPQKETQVSIQDLTKGILPPGANFELIKQAENGKLEEVKAPNEIHNKKKVTFVFLEEQDDGSFKVKGVKANGQQTEEGPEVENILNKIKNGEITLPGQTKISNSNYGSTTSRPTTQATDFVAASSHLPPSYSTFISTSNHGTTGHTIPVTHTTIAPTFQTSFQSTPNVQPNSLSHFPSTIGGTSTERYITKGSTPAIEYTSRNAISPNPRISFPSSTLSTILNSTPYRSPEKDLVVIGSSTIAPSLSESRSTPRQGQSGSRELVDILKENGLFATAKYLRQSGLDTILNETGPYTIFVPTDKAFRTLLVQLGGPDKAEEKFRDNPRLLSGLLLHHVIPGAFDVGSLQDEMTGVSLAGTQLRVNQYDLHDAEWNEVRVTTINGARVLDEKKDINIPQGIAHAVDRVMFPLPVGDLVQTLQADRDRRFTTFIKAIQASGFAQTLTESKTYTVFAPTDAAFARLSAAELGKYADKAGAKALVARHVLPGTLYSAGMRYYQLRNSMEDSKPLTLQKSSGRIKVNNAQVITHNIPATNGVIHAVDAIL